MQENTFPFGQSIIIMGVTGTGKSSVGKTLADAIGAKFIDGDDLHPRANILKMAGGEPLDDQDRAPWLERINDAAFSLEKKNEVGIIVCSSLKKQYRDLIRAGNQALCFLHLQGDFELINARMKARKGHYMRSNLLQSQFDALEMPDDNEKDVIPIKIDASFDQVVAKCLESLNAHYG
ncbi:thermosensitive gluconokinase [Gammaproteobacteria bacterium]|nr:thermosensitive gluconokinase [Gammaproteobacteria bacterium]